MRSAFAALPVAPPLAGTANGRQVTVMPKVHGARQFVRGIGRTGHRVRGREGCSDEVICTAGLAVSIRAPVSQIQATGVRLERS